jgi:hypothetical protein
MPQSSASSPAQCERDSMDRSDSEMTCDHRMRPPSDAQRRGHLVQHLGAQECRDPPRVWPQQILQRHDAERKVDRKTEVSQCV